MTRATQHKRCTDSGFPVPHVYRRIRISTQSTGWCGNCGRTVATTLDGKGVERYGEHLTNGKAIS